MENQLTEITKDLFLGGKLSLLQPKKGFRAGLDSVLLAAAVNAKSGEKVFEIGSGVGTVLFCLMSRISGLKATAIEIMNEYHSLSLINAKQNNFKANLILKHNFKAVVRLIRILSTLLKQYSKATFKTYSTVNSKATLDTF